MGGHSDVLMGAVITNRDDLAEGLKFVQLANGCIPSPFDCALMHRSLRTLELRMQKHMRNGLAVAKFLKNHPGVEKVNHPCKFYRCYCKKLSIYGNKSYKKWFPDLPDHPQYKLAIEQSTGHSGMLSFYCKGDAKKLIKSLKIFALAGSLGGDSSLVEIP